MTILCPNDSSRVLFRWKHRHCPAWKSRQLPLQLHSNAGGYLSRSSRLRRLSLRRNQQLPPARLAQQRTMPPVCSHRCPPDHLPGHLWCPLLPSLQRALSQVVPCHLPQHLRPQSRPLSRRRSKLARRLSRVAPAAASSARPGSIRSSRNDWMHLSQPQLLRRLRRLMAIWRRVCCPHSQCPRRRKHR